MTEKQKEPLVILTGPTAVGKTKLSIALAHAIGGEIISADSMQVYRRMDIGSAKVRPEEMEGVPHYLIDVLEPDEEFHVVRFQQLAKEALGKIRANGHIPIVEMCIRDRISPVRSGGIRQCCFPVRENCWKQSRCM